MSGAVEPGQSAIDENHPWLGLASFTEETRGYFYGREEEVAELGRRVQRKLLTVLFGQSGLGKTSILRAGIVPRLRPEGYCPVYVRIDYSPESPPPSDQIKQAIFQATAVSGQWSQPGTAEQGESLWEFLHHRDDILKDANGKTVIPLLIFDQFEEIFTLAQADDAGRKRAAGFIEDLADLVENRPPKALEDRLENDDTITERFDFNRADYRILIALREDYLAHLESVKGTMPSITQNRMRLARMTGQQALAAVMKPGGKLVTQEIAEAIVRFVAGGSELPNAEVEPSLLSLICRELNNARIAQGRSEISADLLAGSHDTILSEFYERALADQPAAVRKVIEDELLTDSGYRENLAEERLKKAFAAAGAAPDALATLVNRRLLRIEERLDVRRVELTHDVLCGVVKASRELRLEREALEEAEKRLTEQKAREAATRKALIRARQIALGCAVLSVAAAGSAIFGYFSTQRAQRAEADAVKTRAVSEVSRGEAEKLVVFILDDFYEEMAPIGRLDVVGGLARKAVEYYQQLPADARTPETKRNSALAQSRYAEVLTRLGRSDEAQKFLDEASATVKSLRDAGDVSDDTLIAEARVTIVVANNFANRNDQASAIKVINDALEKLKPVLAKENPPQSARWAEATLSGYLGFSLLRSGRPAEAVDAYQRSRALTKQFGAVELTNLAATSGYVSAGWQLGEALGALDRNAEAKTVLNETINLADKLIAVRPGHRRGLGAKSTAYSQLSQIDGNQLQVAAAMRSARESLRVQLEVTALDPGSSASQNNLRSGYSQIAGGLFALGRVDEAWQQLMLALSTGKDERVNGFSAQNLVFWHSEAATSAAAKGDMNRAKLDLASAERYLAVIKATGASERARANASGRITTARGEIALMARGDLATARSELEQSLAARLALFGDKPNLLAAGQFVGQHATVAEICMALGEYIPAEANLRKALAYFQINDTPSLGDLVGAHDVHALLANALARQGKFEEASKVIQPALAYYRQPVVQKSDDETIKYYHSRVLLAAALANPAEKGKYLAEAVQRYDSMAPSLRRLKNFARVRDEIAREMNK
jgi:tetratricopeptide (TPR) repeat protein